MKTSHIVIFFLLTAFVGGVEPAHKINLKLGSLFTDHMVVQRDVPIPVWGQAAPHEQIELVVGDQSGKTQADDNGDWQITVGPFAAGPVREWKISTKSTQVVLKNVVAGEVWLCAGQSNMQWPLAKSADGPQAVQGAQHPQIRLFRTEPLSQITPQKYCRGTWTPCTPKTVANFSAIGYYFAQQLHEHLRVPVGIIHSAQVLTPIEAWLSREALQTDPALREIAARADREVSGYDDEAARNEHRVAMAQWQQATAEARAQGKSPSPQPRMKMHPATSVRFPSSVYHGVVAPLIPFPVKGILWYQGEANASNATLYRRSLPILIADLRRQWGNDALPFIFVQLANYRAAPAGSPRSFWAELRQAQLDALTVPGTAMAVTIDVGDPTDIHPRNKRAVAERLLLAARATAYGESLIYSGPIIDSLALEGKRVRLRFKHRGTGLKPSTTPLEGFELADASRKFIAAQAIVEDDSVVVWSEAVERPTTVRYAWGDDPKVSLYNNERLPASPFTADVVVP